MNGEYLTEEVINFLGRFYVRLYPDVSVFETLEFLHNNDVFEKHFPDFFKKFEEEFFKSDLFHLNKHLRKLIYYYCSIESELDHSYVFNEWLPIHIGYVENFEYKTLMACNGIRHKLTKMFDEMITNIMGSHQFEDIINFKLDDDKLEDEEVNEDLMYYRDTEHDEVDKSIHFYLKYF